MFSFLYLCVYTLHSYLLYTYMCYATKVVADKSVASQWYLIAAKQGHARAQNNLGLLLFTGAATTTAWGNNENNDDDKTTPPPDYHAAASLFRLSAQQGNASAQHNLGVCFESGRGVVRDEASAEEWYRKVTCFSIFLFLHLLLSFLLFFFVAS